MRYKRKKQWMLVGKEGDGPSNHESDQARSQSDSNGTIVALGKYARNLQALPKVGCGIYPLSTSEAFSMMVHRDDQSEVRLYLTGDDDGFPRSSLSFRQTTFKTCFLFIRWLHIVIQSWRGRGMAEERSPLSLCDDLPSSPSSWLICFFPPLFGRPRATRIRSRLLLKSPPRPDLRKRCSLFP